MPLVRRCNPACPFVAILAFLDPILERSSVYIPQVAANQLILGPITVSSIFAWNMIFTGTFDPESYIEKWYGGVGMP